MAHVIIVAGGRGTRMGAPEPKQYLKLNGETLAAHTLRTFCAAGLFEQVMLVLPPQDLEIRGAEISACEGVGQLVLVPGGATRQDSVFNALKALKAHDNDIVCIHDAVRPLVDAAQIKACIEAAQVHGAAVLGQPINETVKRCDANGHVLKTLVREGLWLARTPQAARFELLRRAYTQAAALGFSATDDSSLLEMLDIPVYMVKGAVTNIKITTPEDLELARRLLSKS